MMAIASLVRMLFEFLLSCGTNDDHSIGESFQPSKTIFDVRILSLLFSVGLPNNIKGTIKGISDRNAFVSEEMDHYRITTFHFIYFYISIFVVISSS